MNFRKITFKNIRQSFCRTFKNIRQSFCHKPVRQRAFKPFPGAATVLLLETLGLVDDTFELTQSAPRTPPESLRE